MVFVLVTGPPAAGKSTLARELAERLALPLLAKDTLKRGLLDALGAADVEQSRRLGAAAVEALLTVAGDNAGAVLDSVWVRADSPERLRRLPAPVVEVFCACALDELRRRYRDRAAHRHGRPHDFDLERPDSELWNERSLRPLAGGWPVITVRTDGDLDLDQLVADVREAVSRARAEPAAPPAT